MLASRVLRRTLIDTAGHRRRYLHVFNHPDSLLHNTGAGHPECADRITSIMHGLKKYDFITIQSMFDVVDRDLLEHVHTPAYINEISAKCASVGKDEIVSIGSEPNADTMINTHTLQAAKRAAGAAVAAVNHVMQAASIPCRPRAFVAMRPPGHHAEKQAAMGFCLFNNAAIAAYHAALTYGLTRVAVVDFDVHHGNGTQDILQHDARMVYISTHESGNYPGTGRIDETGDYTNVMNRPLPPHTTTSTAFLSVYNDDVLPALAFYKPQILILSAGFDAHKDDPLSSQQMTADAYYELTAGLLKAAGWNTPVVSLLEGGYNIPALTDSVMKHVEALNEF